MDSKSMSKESGAIKNNPKTITWYLKSFNF